MAKKIHCKYCNALSQTDFCSKEHQDKYESSIAITQIKGPIMAAMRFMAQGDGMREIRFLSGLISCLEGDLDVRIEKLPNYGDICTCEPKSQERVTRIHYGSVCNEPLQYCLACGGTTD
jgi:hypothetical protein